MCCGGFCNCRQSHTNTHTHTHTHTIHSPSLDTLQKRTKTEVVEKTLLFVAGGWASESDSLNSTELFDGTRWDQSVPMVVKRQNSRCHQIGDRIFACGGAEDGSVEVLDMRGVVKKWALVAPMPTPRQMLP